MTRYPTNRERLMDAAGELFYREGLHAITAERVAGQAGLTKPTIYNLFGSKDALVLETLRRRGEQIRRHIEERAAAREAPYDQLLEVLTVHAEMLTSDGFHGCPLIIAAVQAPDSQEARDLANAHKVWLHALLARFARRAGLLTRAGSRGLGGSVCRAARRSGRKARTSRQPRHHRQS